MPFIGPLEILLAVSLIPAIVVGWHSGKYEIKHRWIWILLTLFVTLIGFIGYFVFYAITKPSKKRAL